MDYPGSVLFLTGRQEQYALALDTLAERDVAVRCMDSPLRLAVEFAADPLEIVVIDLEDFHAAALELLEVLREISPTVGVVIAASPEQRELAGSAFSRGADVVVTKPTTGIEMIEAIERAGRRKRLAEGASEEMTAQLLKKFAMGVAHEINNPLTTISGWLQVLIADQDTKPELVDMLTSINEEADRITHVVRQLLAVAQQAPPRQEQLSIGPVLETLVEQYRNEHKEASVNVSTRIRDRLPPIRGDEQQLRQACEALLKESLAALNGRGRLSVSCKPKRHGVEIRIKDTGPPMSAETRAALFEPFEFGRNKNGSGLGLCLARAIVRSHGGTLDVASGESVGTCFRIWLPADTSTQE
jgi:signal transduction histidine kinase